jgi:ubiquinone/menaquinone biosynthesis C-methylase UbiE
MKPAFTDRWIDKFRDVYDLPLSELSWFTAAPGIELMKLIIDGVLRRGDRVVDLGCGPGVDAVFLARQGLTVIGVDLSAEALRRAEAWARLAEVQAGFVRGNVLDVPLASGSADVVTDSFVFHNVRDEARPVYRDEVHRLLRPGGLFILSSFSDSMVPGTGPRRVARQEIIDTFGPDRFECLRLDLYRNLPTEAKPDQIHWLGLFRKPA